MNDFSELESELKKLRPRAASPELTTRVERALAQSASDASPEVSGRIATAGVLPAKQKYRVNWLGIGLGLAAAATVLVLARVNIDHPIWKQKFVAVTPAPFSPPVQLNDAFVPAGVTQVVYNTRDEGLLFHDGADRTGSQGAGAKARDAGLAQSQDQHVSSDFLPERGSHPYPGLGPVSLTIPLLLNPKNKP